MELLHCITLPLLPCSFCFLPGMVVMTLGTTNQVYHYLHPLLSSLEYFIFFMFCSIAERATLPPTAIKITALDCWGGCHSTSTQLPVAPSHLIYPLRDSPVQKKILQNKLKVTEQMGVLSPVGWTR